MFDLNVNYKVINDPKERDSVILDIIKKIDNVNLKPSAKSWNDYWSEFKSLDSPTYLNRQKIFRYNGQYIEAPEDTERVFFQALKKHYFEKYFSTMDVVIEFGCGSGNNLVQLHEIFPNIKLYGLDRSKAAVSLVSRSGFVNGIEFDMTVPNKLTKDTGKIGILTSGSLEQLGENYKLFISFLLRFKADVHVHIEPFIELYDENNLFDYLAITYHKKREYLGRFLSNISSEKKIIEINRTTFGNMYNEGYGVLVH